MKNLTMVERRKVESVLQEANATNQLSHFVTSVVEVMLNIILQ